MPTSARRVRYYRENRHRHQGKKKTSGAISYVQHFLLDGWTVWDAAFFYSVGENLSGRQRGGGTKL